MLALKGEIAREGRVISPRRFDNGQNCDVSADGLGGGGKRREAMVTYSCGDMVLVRVRVRTRLQLRLGLVLMLKAYFIVGMA